jgi:hypothetical protein
MADPPPPAAQPDELSPLDYLLHRGESHPVEVGTERTAEAAIACALVRWS